MRRMEHVLFNSKAGAYIKPLQQKNRKKYNLRLTLPQPWFSEQRINQT